MMDWIDSQTSVPMALIVYAICYALAALIFGVLRLLATRVADHLEAITPAMVTPIGVIGGLIIAFLAARVWSNLDHANVYVAQEANAVRELDRLADEMPSVVREAVRRGAHRYVAWVIGRRWSREAAQFRRHLRVSSMH